jgi:hypothetical protein
MSTVIREYDVVRVRSLEGITADACGLSRRAPAVGDLGAVVAVLGAESSDERYLIECVQTDGATVWIAAFPLASLDVVSRFGEVSR